MRTSKKLLSFFLAVVMVVTTCSVGFTAFAKSNDNIWTTNADAKQAFDTLNGLASDYLPSLLVGISDDIANGVYRAYAGDYKDADGNKCTVATLTDAQKKEIVDKKATVSDVLRALQPMLIGALAKESQDSHANNTFKNPYGPAYYNYLIKDYEGYTDSTGVDFFTLYNLCRKYRNNADLSASTRSTLTEWYNKLDTIANITTSNESQELLDAAISRLKDAFTPNDPFTDFLEDSPATEVTLKVLKGFYTEDYMNANTSEEERTALAAEFTRATTELRTYSVNFPEITDFAEYVYYMDGLGKDERYMYAYIDAFNAAGVNVSYTGNADITGFNDGNPTETPVDIKSITPENIEKAIFTHGLIALFMECSYEDFLAENDIETAGKTDAEVLDAAYEQILLFFSMMMSDEDDPEPDPELAALIPDIMNLRSQAVEGFINTIVKAKYNDLVKGLTVSFSEDYSDAAAVDSTVIGNMPTDYATEDILTESQIKMLASAYANISKSDLAALFRDGSITTKDILNETVTINLPSKIKGTAFASFIADVISKGNNSYYLKFGEALYSEANSSNFNMLLLDDGTPTTSNEVSNNGWNSKVQRDATTNLPVLNYSGASYSLDAIKSFVMAAETYEYSNVAIAALGLNEALITKNSTTGLDTTVNYKAYIDKRAKDQAPEVVIPEVVLTAEQLDILYGDYNLASQVGTDVVSLILNNTIMGIVGNSLVEGIITGFFDTEVDLGVALDGIWARLCDDAVGTIFELLPILVALIDEVVLPVIVNQEGDKGYHAIFTLFEGEFVGGLLNDIGLNIDLWYHNMSFDYGSFIGLTQIGWDLNDLLPKLLDWLLASKADQKAKNVPGMTYYFDADETVIAKKLDLDKCYYDDDLKQTIFISKDVAYTGAAVKDADYKHYTVKDTNGNVITLDKTEEDGTKIFSYNGKTGDIETVMSGNEETEFNCYITYDSRVPILTGIYVADKLLAGACIGDLSSILGKSIKNEDLANGLTELVTELATLLRQAVDVFVNTPEYRNEVRYNKLDDRVFSGLNNIFVAIPRLFDIMADLAGEKYGFPSAGGLWTYCYDGKIDLKVKKSEQSTVNTQVENFKSFAASNDKNRKYDILDWFVGIFVEDWLNSIVSLVNAVITTDNKFSKSFPIVLGLLKALDGFGEKSIFTDVLNGIFMLKRGDKFSFEFSVQSNGLTGLDRDNAYFLISNIQSLVQVIMGLVKSFGSGDSDTASINMATLLSSLGKTEAIKTKASTVGVSGYTSDELASVDSLIVKLDEMISSLLSFSSINDYNLANTGNIVSGLVSLLSNYLGSENAEALIVLLDKYVYYLNGEDSRTPDDDGNMKPNEVYTNKTLSDLVIRTFALIEDIASELLGKFDYTTDDEKTYNLITAAINGLVSPDSIGIRLDGYDKAKADVMSLNSWNAAITDGNVTKTIDFEITAGDKEAFFGGIAASLRLITSILSVILVDAQVYANALEPVLTALAGSVGVKVDTVAEFKDDEVILGIIRPVVGWLDALLAAPAQTIVKSVQGVAGILDDKSGATIASIVSNTIAPIESEILGAAAILELKGGKLGASAPSIGKIIRGFVKDKISPLTTVENNALVNLKIKDVPLSGSNLIAIVNTLLDPLGIVLDNINWAAINKAESPADALAYVIEYVVDTIVKNDNLDAIAALIDKDGTNDTVKTIFDAIKAGKLDGKGIVKLLLKIFDITDKPTLFAWTFEKYLQEAVENFSYPLGLSKAQANNAVENLDTVINNVFPLLASFGLDLGDNIQGIINNNLFKNDLVTTIATALYGAMSSNETVAMILGAIGIKTSPADVAAMLKDASYGATYTSAANAIAKCESWKDVKDINWGFTDGSANAHQGFVNALVAVLRPLNDILAIFLNSGSLNIGSGVFEIIASLNSAPSTNDKGTVTTAITNGVVTITLIDASKSDSKESVIKLDLNALSVLKDFRIYGTNAYNSAIIPLLEALGCKNIVTEAEYKADIAKAKDSLLLDVLNPILGADSTSLLSRIAAKPVQTIATMLPNLACFIDAHGLSQFIVNLLGPITSIIYTAADVIDIDSIINSLLGKSLNEFLEEFLGMESGSINVDLHDLSALNIEDIIIPLVNTLLANNNIDIKIPDINWNVLTSLGTRATYTSAAVDTDGNALTGKCVKDADYGKVLITVLRYVLSVVKNNINTLQSLIGGIDAIKDNELLNSIVTNVFTQLKTHSADQIIVSIYYFFIGNNTSAYWNYSKYTTKSSTFKYPKGVEAKDVAALISFVDAVIEQVDLNAIVGKYLYTDNIINVLAKLIYTNIEKVKISDGITLGNILEIVGINTSTKAVADMLTDSSYGETKQFASAVKAIESAKAWEKVDFDKLKWGVKNQDTFLKALVAILRPFEGLLDVILADGKLNILGGINIPGSNDYVSTIVPLLEAFKCDGVKSYKTYLNDIDKKYDSLLLDILTPLFGFVDKVIENPIGTIAEVLPNIALFIANDGLVQLVANLITPISAIIKDINPIIDVDKLLQDILKSAGVKGLEKLSITNIGPFIADYVSGENLFPTIVSLLSGIDALKGIEIPEIDWFKLASLGKVVKDPSAVKTIGDRIVVNGDSSKVLIAVLRYVLNTVLGNEKFIMGLLGDDMPAMVNDILDVVFSIDADSIIALLFKVVDITQSPTEVYWTFKHYKNEIINFVYPKGLTAQQAREAVTDIDLVINNIFPLLASLGIDLGDDIQSILTNKLFTNELLTKLATALYGAMSSNDTVAMVLGALGIKTSTADVAAILVDKSYGATYTEASKAIAKCKTWNDVKTVNWGFKNGAANAQQGFVNALVAILRPLNDTLAVLLNNGDLKVGSALYDVIVSLKIDGDVSLKKGVLTAGDIKIDFKKVTALKDLNIYGGNGYNSAIITLLETFGCSNVVTSAKYNADIAKAKDNLLLDILNPIVGGDKSSLLSRIASNPVETITTLLPNVACYINAHGLTQTVYNLLAPITELITAAAETLNVNELIEAVLGQSLGELLDGVLGLEPGTLNVDLTDLASLNIEKIVVPLINSIFATMTPDLPDTTGMSDKEIEKAMKAWDKECKLYAKTVNKIKLPDINLYKLISLGEYTTYTSKAVGANGKQLTGKHVENADYGKVLITLLRYVLGAVKSNIKYIEPLLNSIDAIKNNDLISGILGNVFTQIKTHSADQIIVAIYYFFVGDNTDAYWNYADYITKELKFAYPNGVTENDVKRLITFIDGIVSELDLDALLNHFVYTDNIINTLAKALYTSLGGIKLSDSIALTDILSIVGIGLDKNSVVSMLTDSRYGETKQFAAAAKAIDKAASFDKVDFDKLSWGVKDQKTFINALVAVLRPFEGLLAAIVADDTLNILGGIDIPGSNDYVSTIVPLLEAFRCKDVKSYETYLADIEKSYDSVLLDVLNPIFGLVNTLIENPIDTLASVLPNLALFIANDGLIQLIVNLITPITAIVEDINPIIDVDKLLQDLLGTPAITKTLAGLNLDINKLSITNLGSFIEPLIGSENIIPLVNSLLESTGIVIPEINWFKLASCGEVKNEDSAVKTIGKRIVVDGNSSQVIVTVLRFVLDAVLGNADAIKGLIGDKYTGVLKDILDMVFALKGDDLISLVFSLLDITQSPAEVFWCYENYKSQLTSFKYPVGITAADAEKAVGQLDSAVAGVFGLLQGLGVVDAADLPGLVNGLLFKNEMLTKLTTTLYGALSGEKIAPYISGLGIPVTPKEVAKVLTDKSYGKTYSSAAATLAKCKSWNDVKTLNWGFTDGSAMAEQGFVNALVAVIRPFLDIVGPFLNGSNLELGKMLLGVICALDIQSGDKSKGEMLVSFRNGVLKVDSQTNGKYENVINLDLSKLSTLETLNLYGSNAYESAIIPLLDVLQVDNSEIKTFDQYVKDCAKAKDNILLDVLNPLMSFIDRVLEAPFDTITSVLPNLAYFIDNNGIGQLLDNVLSPVTEFLRAAKKDGVDIDAIIKTIAGKDLSKVITDLIGIDGVKFNLKLTDLKSCDIQEIVVPLINKLISGIGIKLPYFQWSTIASHGKAVTSASKAENSTGSFTNKEIIADKGEVLVAVLRYVANVLVTNANGIKNLLCNIDAIKKNDTIGSIIKSVFNTISTATADQIVVAVFYFLLEEPTNAFWNYTEYKTGEYDFSYPEAMDVDFLKNLPPMLDGLVSGLIDLNGLINEKLFTDALISKLATALYGAIEGVKINDNTNLAQLLAKTDIDVTTAHVAKLLVDEKYGQQYPGVASTILSAGSWSKVNPDSLKWGVKDRATFFHALVAVLRPLYGVLDVLLNDASLGLFHIVRIPGSNGYTSSIVPLMEAFSMYNIKTQYQYRQDIVEEYDQLLLDIINPLWDKVEDILSAPLQTLFAMLPNLALFIGNNGLCQIIDNLLTPVSALIDAIRPVVDLNDLVAALLTALKVDLNGLLGKIGITNFKLDLYDLNATLKQVLGGDELIPLVNNILGIIKIKGTPLGLKLNAVDWLQLASHGKQIVSASQAATYGSRIFVEGDSSETLIAVLRYLIQTVNTGDNFKMISGLIGGLLGDNVSESISGVIDQVLGMLQGDTDDVIFSLVDLLHTLA